MIEIKCNTAPILASSMNRCFANVARVESLLDVYKESQNEDILRMCVSFLHATIEDCMRNLLFYSLTTNPSQEQLNKVPLKGVCKTNKPEKFFLGALVGFENETLDTIISESVEKYVNRLTFNNSNDIINSLIEFKVEKSKIVPLLVDIDELISRRHNIVHNSDFTINRSVLNSSGTVIHSQEDTYDLTPIDEETLNKWISTTSMFFMTVIPLFLPKGKDISFNNI